MHGVTRDKERMRDLCYIIVNIRVVRRVLRAAWEQTKNQVKNGCETCFARSMGANDESTQYLFAAFSKNGAQCYRVYTYVL